jgi:hypothetical protein
VENGKLDEKLEGIRLSVAQFLVILFVSVTFLTGCVRENVKLSVAQDKSSASKGSDSSELLSVDEVMAVAAACDAEYTDGWICSREPRILKSPYGKISPQEKADFAMAYRQFIESGKQDLLNRPLSYIPYKERANFARNYWQHSAKFGAQFCAEKKKMQVCWVHESLLDGGELWWRAAEKHFGDKINSLGAMAHDNEQDMVFHYMDSPGSPSSFAFEYARAPEIIAPN